MSCIRPAQVQHRPLLMKRGLVMKFLGVTRWQFAKMKEAGLLKPLYLARLAAKRRRLKGHGPRMASWFRLPEVLKLKQALDS